jgi:hypothetical protein
VTRRGTFSTRRTCSVKSTGRVVESILFETCSPIKPVLAMPFRDEWRGDFVFSCPSCFRCARHASARRTNVGRFPRKPKETNGGRYRILTCDFHRVKVARHFVIRELRRTLGSAQECSGAYFQKLTNTGQKAGPINGPTSNRVGTQFSFDSLCILAVAVLPTVADWPLLRAGNWTQFTC